MPINPSQQFLLLLTTQPSPRSHKSSIITDNIIVYIIRGRNRFSTGNGVVVLFHRWLSGRGVGKLMSFLIRAFVAFGDTRRSHFRDDPLQVPWSLSWHSNNDISLGFFACVSYSSPHDMSTSAIGIPHLGVREGYNCATPNSRLLSPRTISQRILLQRLTRIIL